MDRLKESDILYENSAFWVLGCDKIPLGGGVKTKHFEVYESGITHSTWRFASMSFERAKKAADNYARDYRGPFGARNQVTK